MGKAGRRVMKNTMYLYIKMGITMFISLYITRLILNSLGISDFGIYNVVAGIIAMLGFLNATMANASQRFMSFYEGKGDLNQQKIIFNVSVILHIIISCVFAIILLILGYLFFNGVLTIPPERLHAAQIVYYLMIISTIITIVTVPYDAVLNAHENMLYFSIVGIVEAILKLGVAFFVVYTKNDKLIVYAILMAVVSFIIMLIMRIYCHIKYTECVIAPRKYWNKKMLNEMLKFASWSFVGSSSSVVGNHGRAVILNHFFGTILNASNGIAAQLNGQLLSFSNNMLKALNPLIVKKEGSGERTEMFNYALKGSKFSFLLLAFFALPLLFKTQQILELWLKVVPDWTVLFCQLALIRSLIEQLGVTLSTTIGAIGKIKNVNIFVSVSNIVSLLLIAMLFKYHGSPAWQFIVPIFLLAAGNLLNRLYNANKLGGLKYSLFFKEVFYPSFIVSFLSIASCFIMNYLLDESIAGLILFIVLCMLIFIVLSFVFALNSIERNNIHDLIKLILQKISK